jgi:hypothetical protein
MAMRFRVTSFLVSVFALLVLFSNGAAHAGLLVYSNGEHNYGPNNSFSYGDVFVGQDFTLHSDATLSQLVFNAYTVDGVTEPLSGVHVKIYSALDSGVGAELFSGVFGASATDTGQIVHRYRTYSLKDFTVDLPAWSLPAGTYWLGLQVDPAQREMYWTITGGFASIGLPSRRGNHTGDPVSYGQNGGYDYENEFRLFAELPALRGVVAPEPGTIAIWSLLGLVWAGGTWYRRKRDMA